LDKGKEVIQSAHNIYLDNPHNEVIYLIKADHMTDNAQQKGYDDQELLFRAIVTFVCTQINRSDRIIGGLMRQSINEWSAKNEISVRKLKSLDEKARLKAVSELIDIFNEKVKHLVNNRFLREKLKENILLIYKQWKESKRIPDSE
jgi:hypothetical protein